jgi:catechol 2,3-dioxygenase-like lactoylglutathione lyase family enzyme
VRGRTSAAAKVSATSPTIFILHFAAAPIRDPVSTLLAGYPAVNQRSMTSAVRSLSPILPVEEIDRSVAFYTEVLRFEVKSHSPNYAILTKGNGSIILTRAESPSVMDDVMGHMSFYLEVDAIEPLWAHVSQFKERYKTREPFDREYGMREFHIIDPDGCLIFVGEPIPSSGV